MRGDDEFHEFNLDGKQLVFLFMSATVVAVVVFLCGVMVGRGVRVARAEEPVEFAAATAVDPVGRPAPEEPLDVTSPPTRELPPLSYSGRLGTSPPEVLREPAPVPAAPPVAESAAAAAPAPATTPPRPSPTSKPAARGAYFVQVAAVTGRAEAERKEKELPRSYSTTVVPADSMFKVWVGPYSTKKEAESVVARLRRQRKYKDAWVTSK